MNDPLFDKTGELASMVKQLAKQAVQQYSPEVDLIIASECRDDKQIEHLLEGMLEFCFDEKMLLLYKKLCRYYFSFNPEITAYHINAYRERWDDDDNNKVKNK